MKRICPFCNYNLTQASVYFCENCGSVLPDEFQLQSVGSVFENREISKEDKKKKKNRDLKNSSDYKQTKNSEEKLILLFVAICFVMALGALIFLLIRDVGFFNSNFFGNKSVSSPEETAQKEVQIQKENSAEDNCLYLGLNLSSGPFWRNDVLSYVPYDADFYIEINDASTLNSYFSFLGGEFFTLSEILRDNIKSSYSAFHIKKGADSSWVIIVFPNDKSFQVREFENIFTDLVDDALVISSKPALIEEVKMVKSEISKNISMHPLFISAKPFIANEGQVFMLKITSDADIVIDNVIRETLSDDLRLIMKSFRDSEKSYLVIK
jgi:hypothetical protein